MQIEHSAGISRDKIVGDNQQEAGQDDEVDAVALQQGEHHLRVVELPPVDHHRRHAQILGTHQGVGVSAVADDKTDFHRWIVGEMADDVLAVASVAGDEDGKMMHGCL